MTPTTHSPALARTALLSSVAFGLLALATEAGATITATRNGSNLATRNYPSGATSIIPVIVTVTPTAGTTSTATLDGVTMVVGTPVTVSTTGYHEVIEQKQDGSTELFQFIIASPGRGTSEMGLPMMVPYHYVNDAPSAINTGSLMLMAPTRYPLNLPVPVVGRLLKNGAGAGPAFPDPLWLHGDVASANHPTRGFHLRRGWGSTILPAQTTAGDRPYDAKVADLKASAPITFEETTTWTTVSGNITGNVTWAADSRVAMASIVVKAGATLSVEAGTVVKADPGAEVWVEPGGTVNINGTIAQPVVFAPANTAAPWGGFWLHQGTAPNVARVTATGTIFCCWGANQNWYTQSGVTPSRTIFDRHRQQQPCFAVATAAVCTLTDCAIIGPITMGEPKGALFASRDGTLNLTRVLAHRAITGGEQRRGTVEIDSSAFMEFSEINSTTEGSAFDDADNDGLYLYPDNGFTYHVSKTVIGWTVDDGIDSGGSNGGSTICNNCWFENCVHEAFSNSGGGRQPQSHNGVHFNCGQGMECGYGDSGAGGPISLVNHSLLIGCQVGVRYGDNYNSFGTYEGTMTAQDSFLLYNMFRDGWAMEWRSSSNWQEQNARLIAKNTKFSRSTDLAKQNGAEDSGNSLWNPASDGAQIASFMPVPNSNVGLAILATKRTDDIANFPTNGQFTVRLSTFSSKAVTTDWALRAKTTADASAETTVASGTLTFAPGETVKTITAPLPVGHSFGFAHLDVHSPVNAEITGNDLWFFKPTNAAPADQALITRRSAGWSYNNSKTDLFGTGWDTLTYSPIASWVNNATAPIGWGNIGAAAPYVTFGTTLTDTSVVTVYYRKSFTVADPSSIRALNMEILRDDGAVIFINGTRFPLLDIDPGTIVGGEVHYNLRASTGRSGSVESSYDALSVPSNALAALVAGTNILAIEIHQESGSTTDHIMDASLTASFLAPGTGNFGLGHSGDALFLYWDDAGKKLQESADLISWDDCPSTSPFLLNPSAAERKFYRLAQ